MNRCYCVTHNKQLGKDIFMNFAVRSVSQKQFVPISLSESTKKPPKNDVILKDGKNF